MTAKRLGIVSSSTNEPILLVPSGKIRCYIHPDVLRNDTPEEHVRQRVARSLVLGGLSLPMIGGVACEARHTTNHRFISAMQY